MTSPPSTAPPHIKSTRLVRIRKRILIAFASLFAFTAILLIAEQISSRHPQLGRIYHTSAHDLNVVRSNPVAKFLSRNLPRSILQSKFYPERLKDQPKYLRLGDHQMEWSIGGPQTGWLYFWNVDHMPRAYPWEFAETDQTNFLSLQRASIPTLFKGPADLPAHAPSTNAINCSAGAILFARHRDETNKSYILHLQRQEENKLFVEYCVVPIR
jgi:hypothetical protein